MAGTVKIRRRSVLEKQMVMIRNGGLLEARVGTV